MSGDRINYGEVAYNAYCEHRGWKSIRGDPLPKFEAQSEDLKEAWVAAGNAAVQEYKEDQDILD